MLRPNKRTQQYIKQKNINIYKLDPEKMIYYSELLYPIFASAIKGWDYNKFAQDFFYKNNLYSNDVTLFYNDKNDIIGFNLHQVIKKKFEDRWHYIIKFYAVVIPEFKKNNLAGKDGYTRIFKLKMTHPWSRVYFVDFVMSPVSYYQLIRHCLQAHPRPGIDVPIKYKKLILQVAEEYKLRLIDEDKLIAKSSEYVYISEQEKEMWRQSSEPKIEYFVKNVGLEGNGIFVLIHVTFYNIVVSFFQTIKNSIKR